MCRSIGILFMKRVIQKKYCRCPCKDEKKDKLSRDDTAKVMSPSLQGHKAIEHGEQKAGGRKTTVTLAAKDWISIFPIAVQWNHDYSIDLKKVKLLKLPWRIVKKEAHDRGSYLFLLKLRKKVFIRVEGLGDVSFRKGYYIYVGSARKNLSKRLERHKRQRKNTFWHIDYLRGTADVHTLLPILSEDDLECPVAHSIRDFADWEIPCFGSSDCTCPSHLFGTENDPLANPQFHKILQYFRMERLIEKYKVL